MMGGMTKQAGGLAVEALAQVRPWLGGGEGGGLVCKTHGLTGVTRPQSVMCVLGGGL